MTSAIKSVAETVTTQASSAAESVGAAAETARSYASGVGDSDAQRRAQPEESTTVYVGNLFFDVTTEDLKREFSKAGDVEHVKIVYDTRGLSKG